MCGIVGFVGDGSRSDLTRMTSALAHRGPDDAGYFVDESLHIFLGHRRLAIVDVKSGHQPMWNEDGQVGVIFNGEIYNHRELRELLSGRGHRFHSDHSDTEVLVHGWEEWGEDLPERLNGMFAFAILDRGRRRIFLARDRFGEKPLYYSARPGFFAFASELTALVKHPAVDRSLAPRAVQKYFAYGYVPAPHSIIPNVFKLPGGQWLKYDIDSQRHEIKSYWRFVIEPDEALTDADEPRLIEECRSLITIAVKRRLMSDVPLGIFLSGGLDSSLVLALLAKSQPASSLSTFTIGFEDRSFDESVYAAIVAKHIGSDHHVRHLTFDHARELIDRVLGSLDEPLADASILPTYLLSAFTREKVTVALSGDGGDELFAGYDPFVALAPGAAYERLVPLWGHRALRRLAQMLPISHKNMSFDFKLRRALMGLGYRPAMRLPIWMSPIDPKDMKELFECPLSVEELYDEAIALWEADPKKKPIDRALEFFTRMYLQDDILAKVDRAAMMCSLETRAVFLDNDFVEFCRRLPARFKLRHGERKYLLKKVARTLLPSSIIERKKKGFGIPLAKWLRQLPHMPTAFDIGVRFNYAKRAFTEHRSGQADNRTFLWAWMVMQRYGVRSTT
jgi:asparagine synthase (glutamine-hydrolysing)